MSDLREGTQEGAGAIPENLHANANEEKRREAQNDVHAGGADEHGETVGETVAEKDADGDERGADDGCGNGEEIAAEMARGVSAKSDGDRDGAGTNGEWKSERIEGVAEDVLRANVAMVAGAIGFILAFEHGPASGNDDEAAANLHDGEGDAKEIKDTRADQKGSDEQDEAIERDAAREKPASGGGIFSGEGQEEGAAPERIDNGKKGAEKEKRVFSGFEHENSEEEV